MSPASLATDPVALLQRLIRFDTTNPPGDTRACMGFIRDLLSEAGLEPRVLAKSPQQPNVVARLPGRGEAPPLLLYGHVDVVTAEDQDWRYPPFEGVVAEGFVWGRGALDMKGGVAMMLAALLQAQAQGLRPAGDVLFVALSDEEAGGDLGAKFLVDEHPELFAGVRYALGEFGGFTMHIGGRRFYPIQVAEKQICWLRATFHGPGGHGSMPVRGGAMAKLGAFLQRLDQARLPVHVTPVARAMFQALAAALDEPLAQMFAQLTDPDRAPLVLEQMGPQARMFDALLHHTVSPTVLHGSRKINVIPSRVSVELDGRLLPGFEPADLLDELQAVVGDDATLEVLRFDPGPPEPDMGLFPLLAQVLRSLDPEGVPIPLLLTGVTDARHFARLGIQTYGFLPMPLPPDFAFGDTIHAANERIPVDALPFGTQALYAVLERYAG